MILPEYKSETRRTETLSFPLTILFLFLFETGRRETLSFPLTIVFLFLFCISK